ncbi:MAG: glycosyltransferase [Chthoniobacterales bacterium]
MSPGPLLDLNGKRVLVFIVAYNAEATIEKVLSRVPASLHQEGVEVLIIDDSSRDETFINGLRYQRAHSTFKITVLRTPENQGYGGNQKLGYRYAIDNNFEIVALVHADGQYAPEKLPALLAPLLAGDADAVFGSRMIDKRAARAGGMPLYKWLGNQILTGFQNRVLGTDLSEFHSGYRLYSTAALAQIPFERNTNDFHFDTEIIIQLVLKKLRIVERSIPTFYGDEICHVNGIKYAFDIFLTTLRARLQRLHLFYDRKFEVDPPSKPEKLKLGFESSHTLAASAARAGRRVLDIGCGQGQFAGELARKGCRVTGIDRSVPSDYEAGDGVRFIRWNLDHSEFPIHVSEFDQIFLLDILEHLKAPEEFMDELRFATGRKRPEIILTTANIGFFTMRLMLLCGHFNYGRRGLLDLTHTRLFTFRSLRELLKQSDYKILEMRGIPAPFPKAIGDNFLSRFLLLLNCLLIRLSPELFAYQIFARVEARPTVHHLLGETIAATADLRRTVVVG